MWKTDTPKARRARFLEVDIKKAMMVSCETWDEFNS